MFSMPMAAVQAPGMGEMILGGSNIPSGPAPMPAACQIVEEALHFQIQMAGGGQMGIGMDMQLRIARAYRELARRACLQNRTFYAIQFRAAIEVAWALLDIEHPLPAEPASGSNGEVDQRIIARQQKSNELREIERAPASHGW